MSKKYPNRIVVNVKSPKNEAEYINAYKQLNPSAKNMMLYTRDLMRRD